MKISSPTTSIAGRPAASIRRMKIECIPDNNSSGISPMKCSNNNIDSSDDETGSLSASSTSHDASASFSPFSPSSSKSVRFSLESNQFHEAETPTPILWLQQQQRSVTFCLKENEYYDNDDDYDDENCLSLKWYHPNDIFMFEQQVAADAQAMFLQLPMHKEESSTASTSNIQWWKALSLLPSLPATTTTTATTSTKCLQGLYQLCTEPKSEKELRRIRRSGMMDKARDELQDLYHVDNDQQKQQPCCLVGLEHVAIYSQRGDAAALRRFILAHGGSDNDNDNNSAATATLRHVSQCISRPARLWAQEIALAHLRSMTD